jgi:acyl carrier protein
MRVEPQKRYTVTPLDGTTVVIEKVYQLFGESKEIVFKETSSDFRYYLKVCIQKEADILNSGIDCDEEHKTEIANFIETLECDWKEESEYDVEIHHDELEKEDVVSDLIAFDTLDSDEYFLSLDYVLFQTLSIRFVGPIEIKYVGDF